MKGKFILYLFIILILGIFAYFSLYSVDESEQVVVKEFGKIIKVEKTAGLHFKLPWWQVEKYEKRLLIYDAQPTEIITKDKKTLVIDNYACWRIAAPDTFEMSVKTLENANLRLHEIIFSEIRNVIGNYTLSEVIKEKDEMMEKVKINSNKKASKLGIEIVDVRIKKSDLPKENLKNVYKRIEAERMAMASKYRAEGKEIAQKIIAQTNRERDSILAYAQKTAQYIKAEGDSLAYFIYSNAYSKNKKFFKLYENLLFFENTIDSSSILVIPIDSRLYKLLIKESR